MGRSHFVTLAATRLARRRNKKERGRNKNVHFHPSQKQRTTPPTSQGGGASSALLSPCSDLRQDFVPRRRHPRTLHDRTEDGEGSDCMAEQMGRQTRKFFLRRVI